MCVKYIPVYIINTTGGGYVPFIEAGRVCIIDFLIIFNQYETYVCGVFAVIVYLKPVLCRFHPPPNGFRPEMLLIDWIVPWNPMKSLVSRYENERSIRIMSVARSTRSKSPWRKSYTHTMNDKYCAWHTVVGGTPVTNARYVNRRRRARSFFNPNVVFVILALCIAINRRERYCNARLVDKKKTNG